MLGVLVTFRYGNQFNEAQVRQIAEEAQGRFKGMPGLRSKAFTVDAAKREAVNFYVWDSESAGRAFFTPALLERVAGLDPALVSRTSDCWYILMNGARYEQERGG